MLLVASLIVASGGCGLMSRSLRRPDPHTVSGPAPYVETCTTCHAGPITTHYAESRHAAQGIHCGQCHAPDGHPDFTQPVADGKCGGCHQAQYQQTLASKHFAGRVQRELSHDRPARAALRNEGFAASTPMGRRFVGDASSGDLGGRLCAACHYDEHRLDLGLVERPNFCVGCHQNRERHFSDGTPDVQNRCLTCHLHVGKTVAGQIVNTHRFAVPGAENASP